ncbi:hypothetical protein [Kangiella sp.]|uniref:hypothetical protein n=1 Tax=Kangiella sp. TaxID=1920245 RepID=UPI0019B3D698|nr:hypothetical protein [Kangiella sp.]MBD3653872.1 hypothetical protein [Kangiella sp.]
MKKIEQILSTGNAFKVDNIACMQHAEVLKHYQRPAEFFTWSDRSLELQLAFKVAFISICHQFNWDFMQATLAAKLLKHETDFAEYLLSVKSTDLSDWLKKYPKQERVRAKERAFILRDVGKTLSEVYAGSLERFYEHCSRSFLDNSNNKQGESFHEIMDQFEGFRKDSLKKKTNVLSHDLIKENIVSFVDEENSQPAIDYHIMRLYIRTGRVIPTDPSLFKFLSGAPNPRGTLVRLLREAVAQAERLTAYYSGLNVADLNYIEWQIGRSICKNKAPVCQSLKFPSGFPDDVSKLCDNNCPYIEICLSYNQMSEFISFEEPLYVSTDY